MSVSGDTVETTDNELLMQFVRHRDEHAFRQLVERHAALVMSVCRQMTRDEQDAEDAFQATLLILASRAGRLLQITSLGGWLHRVAYRTALRAGRRRARRRESHLAEEPAMKQSDALQEIHSREVQQVLHEELQQIPIRYRNAIVMCDLEGNTRAQAADQLDCTEPAIKAALARGRRQLRLRLLRRGMALSVAIITAKQAIASAQASVTSRLIDATISSCMGFSGGANLGWSKSVHSLVQEGELVMMLSSMTKPLSAVSIAAALVAAPLILLAQISAEPREDAKPTVVADSTADHSQPPAVDSQRITRSSDAVPRAETGPTERIESLLTERLETLRQIVKHATEQYVAGQIEIDNLIRARLSLLDAELETASTRAQRTRVYGERLKFFRDLEGAVKQQQLAGTTTMARMLSVKAERLEAEIVLLREQDPVIEKRDANGVNARPAPSTTAVAEQPVALHKYVLGIGDVLGVYIEGVLGGPPAPALVIPNDPGLPPAAGFPILVLGDGRINVPLVPPLEVKGKTLRETAAAIRRAYTIDNTILRSGQARIMVTLIKRRTAQVTTAIKAKIQPGDTLGIYVEGVVGAHDGLPIVHLPKDRARLPVIGFPFSVQSDGTIDLPLVRPVKVSGKTLPKVREAVIRAYTIDQKILHRGQDAVMVTLIQKYREDERLNPSETSK